MRADCYADKTAVLENVNAHGSAKVFKECMVKDCTLGEKSSVGDFSRLTDCHLGQNVLVQRNALMFSTRMGTCSYVGKNFVSWHCEIGKFCSISWNVSIGGANHDYSRATTHSFLYSNNFGIKAPEETYDRFSQECTIGNDVWIEANVCICRGVRIGNGAVIAAGAVVTKDVEPYTIFAGVPAKEDNIHLFNQKMTKQTAKEIYDLSRRSIKEES